MKKQEERNRKAKYVIIAWPPYNSRATVDGECSFDLRDEKTCRYYREMKNPENP